MGLETFFIIQENKERSTQDVIRIKLCFLVLKYPLLRIDIGMHRHGETALFQ